MARNPLREVVKESLAQKANVPKVFYGTLGDALGTVSVPGRDNYVYVTLNDGMVAQAYNTVAPAIANYPVIIGFDPRQSRSDLLCVLGVRDVPRIGKSDSAYNVDNHHVSHEWLNAQGGTDVTYVQLRQFMPLRPTPIEPYSVNIARDVQMINGEWTTVGAVTLDLTSYVPTTYTGSLGNERFVVLSLSPTSGSVTATSGSLVVSGSSSFANIPAAPEGDYPLCAVRLYTDQVKIIEARSATDLIDLRWGVFANPGMLHNSLGGLQGGVSGEYYHLRADQTVPVATAPVDSFYLTGYDAVSGSFSSGSVVGGSSGSGGGIEEAPVDGKTYGRKDAAWAEVISGSSGGASTLAELTDVSISGSQANNSPLVWNTSGSSWGPGTAIKWSKARSSVDQSVSTSPGNRINFGTVEYDEGSCITTGSASWVYTAPATGMYTISGQIGYRSGVEVFAVLYISGSVANLDYHAGITTSYNSVAFSWYGRMIAGQNFYVFGKSSTGTLTTFSAWTFINILYLGP